jgi:LemA protein
MQVKINEASSGIDVALTKRYDFLTKELGVAKTYAKHEKETLYETIKMRSGLSMSEKNAVNDQLNQMEITVKALAESYPEIKADKLFIELQRNIKDAEEHLQASRRLYNSNVSEYNQLLSIFPINLFFKFQKRSFV